MSESGRRHEQPAEHERLRKGGPDDPDVDAAGAAHVIVDVRPSGDLEFVTRGATGGATTFLATAFKTMPTWLRLDRSGNTVTAYVSLDES